MADYLLHFTGRKTIKDPAAAFETLKSICTNNELWMFPCPTFKGEPWRKDVRMTCLTDIKLSDCNQHSAVFGQFVVGFNLDKLKAYGATPVFYATEQYYERIKGLTALVDRMKESEKDREWRIVPGNEPEDGIESKEEIELREKLGPYQFTEDETVSLMILSGLLQEYTHKRKDTRNQHQQREWRIIFDALKFASGSTDPEPGMSCVQKVAGKDVWYMKFDPDDIEFFVVPRSHEEQGRKLATQIGKPFKILEKELADD
jgi:hypothetical protein